MDPFTRRMIGLAVRPAVLDGPAVCRMFNDVPSRSGALPQLLSSDHDPLFLSRIHSSSGSSEACAASSWMAYPFRTATNLSASSPNSCAITTTTARTERSAGKPRYPRPGGSATSVHLRGKATVVASTGSPPRHECRFAPDAFFGSALTEEMADS